MENVDKRPFQLKQVNYNWVRFVWAPIFSRTAEDGKEKCHDAKKDS